MKNIIDALKWRYAVQTFDQNKKLTTEQLNTILEAARLSPSSYGLQLWKFIVVNNPDIRSKLREAGYGQPKITEASHLIVIAVPKIIDDSLIEKYINQVAEVRKMPIENLDGLRKMIHGAVNSMAMPERIEWAARQAYIALGVILSSSALEGIDAGPMEGFEPGKVDAILGLDKLGLESKVMVALGFRSDKDAMAKVTKVRYPKSEIVMEVN